MKKWFLSFAATAVAMSVMFSTVAFAENGRITASVGDLPTLTGTPAERTELLTRINYAKARLDETFRGNTEEEARPANPPAEWWWITQTGWNALNNAVIAAEAALTNFSTAPGGAGFDVTIGIEGNTGFAGMIMRLGFPTELEILSFHDYGANYGTGAEYSENEDFYIGFQPPLSQWAAFPLPTDPANDPTSIEIARTAGGYNYLHAGWAGRTADFTVAEGNLFRFRVRVAPGTPAGFLQDKPITIAIANAIPPYNENPTNFDMDSLVILLPCGKVGGGLTAEDAHGNVGFITVTN
jgi:hypothetical protein